LTRKKPGKPQWPGDTEPSKDMEKKDLGVHPRGNSKNRGVGENQKRTKKLFSVDRARAAIKTVQGDCAVPNFSHGKRR